MRVIRKMQRVVIALFILVLLAFCGLRIYRRVTVDTTPPVITCSSDSIDVSVTAGEDALLQGVMASDDEWYGCLTRAAGHSGERFWRMPDFPEYEDLIRSDYADVRNTSKDGCGAITAGLFLKHFTQGLPWLHLDIAGTADNNTGITWQHQTPGATGAAVSTLYYLARELENA